MSKETLRDFEGLARPHEAMLLAYVLSLVSDRGVAEEIAQQTWVVACHKHGSLKDPSTFPAWLRRIAQLETVAALKRRGASLTVEPELMRQLDEAYRSFDERREPGTWAGRFGLLEECFGQLPENLADVCRLYYFEDRKTREMAVALATSVALVLKRVERARNSLRDCLRHRLTGTVG